MSSHISQQHQWTQEDEARLQATLILGSLASGGQAFVQPLLAAEAQKYLLEALVVETVPRLVTATLQALRSLAASAAAGTDSREQMLLRIFDRSIEPFLVRIPTSITLLHKSNMGPATVQTSIRLTSVFRARDTFLWMGIALFQDSSCDAATARTTSCQNPLNKFETLANPSVFRLSYDSLR